MGKDGERGGHLRFNYTSIGFCQVAPVDCRDLEVLIVLSRFLFVADSDVVSFQLREILTATQTFFFFRERFLFLF